MPETKPTFRTYLRKGTPYIWAEYSRPDGTVVRESTRCRDQGAADQWLALRQTEYLRGQAGVRSATPCTIADASAEYLALREKTWSGQYYDTVFGLFRYQVLPFFGNDEVMHAIDRIAVSRFRDGQIKRPSKRSRKNPTPISDATVNRLFAALAAFGEWCRVHRNYLVENPFAKWEALEEGDKDVPAAHTSELDAFVAALPASIRDFVLFALDTGLRKGEVEKLERHLVNVRERTATVKRTKNKKKDRTVALTGRCLRIVEGLPRRPDGLLFGVFGDHRRAFATAAKAAGLRHVWPHALRHFWASRMAASGASVAEMMEGGGWTTPRMVGRYATAGKRRLAEAARRMEAADEAERGAQPAHTADPGKGEGDPD